MFDTIKIEGKEYKRKIVGLHSLTPTQKKKLRELPHLWKLGYCGSIIEKDTVIEAYRPLSKIDMRIALRKKKAIEDEELEDSMKAYPEDFEGSYIYYDDEDIEAEEEDP